MIRPLVLAAVVLASGAAMAQEAAPVPPATDIVIDPAATINTTPKQANILTGFYATQAVIELCDISLEPGIVAGMEADRARLESALAMDAPTAETAYSKVKADVERTEPDCTDGSSDRLGVEAVTSIYANAAAPAAAGTATPAAGTTTPAAGPATPAAPATP